MRDFERNEIRTYTKINHIFYCQVAFEAKDVGNFIRHYLWLRLDWSGEFYDEQSLRASLVGLTGWDGNVIKNAIARLIKNGEIERLNPNHFRFNHKLANKFGYVFYSKYEGQEPKLSPAQRKLQTELEKLVRHTRSSLPQNQKEMDELEKAEEQGIESMVALKRIDKLTVEIQDLKAMIADLVQHIVIQPEIPDDIKQVAKRKLALVVDEK